MIVLQNPGELELAALTTMGVSVKDTENPIGQFGTGFKYAIAVFLREHIDFSLYIGLNQYSFYTERVFIREKSFNLCKMQGSLDSVDLGFTTELGKNWKVWQAYRELESNCRDEKGSVSTGIKKCFPKRGFTTLAINDDLKTFDLSSIFIDSMSRKLLVRNKSIEIFEGKCDYIYYKGIRAYELEKPSLYTYNILKRCDLTEDRTLCYSFQIHTIINETIAKLQNKDVIKDVVTVDRNHYESRLDPDLNNHTKPGKEFLTVVAENETKVHNDVRTYIDKHKPKKPPTKQEIKDKFLRDLDNFCIGNKLNFTIDRDGYVTIIACDILKGD